VTGLDGPEQRRERWALGVIERKAGSLGVLVAAFDEPADLVERLARDP
jgi:hypothetical protein